MKQVGRNKFVPFDEKNETLVKRSIKTFASDHQTEKENSLFRFRTFCHKIGCFSMQRFKAELFYYCC